MVNKISTEHFKSMTPEEESPLDQELKEIVEKYNLNHEQLLAVILGESGDDQGSLALKKA